MRVTGWRESVIRVNPRIPARIGFLVVADDMVTVFRLTVLVHQVGLQADRRVIHRVGIPGRITGKTFVLSSPHVMVPTKNVPRVVCFADTLHNLAGCMIAAVVFFAVHAVMDTGGRAAMRQIGHTAEVIAFHVVDHDKAVTIAGGAVVTCWILPDGWTVIGARLHCHWSSNTSEDRDIGESAPKSSTHQGWGFSFHIRYVDITIAE